MSDQMLTVATEHLSGGVVVLTAGGEIDHDSQPVLGEAATAALERGGNRLVIDLDAVTFCDSGGLRLFVRLHQDATARGGSVYLAAAHGPVRLVLDVSNLDRLLSMHATRENAVQAALAAD